MSSEAPLQDKVKSRLENWFAAVLQSRLGHWLFARPWVIVLTLTLFVSLLVTPHVTRSTGGNLEVGTFAPRTIKATRDFQVFDVVGTGKRREEAAATIPPVYFRDELPGRQNSERLAQAFAEMRKLYGIASVDAAKEGEEMGSARILSRNDIQKARNNFHLALNLTRELDDDLLNYLDKDYYSVALENEIRVLVERAYESLIVDDRQALLQQTASLTEAKVVELRQTGAKEAKVAVDKIKDIPAILTEMEQWAGESQSDPLRRRVLTAIARELIRPTLVYDQTTTEEHRNEARDKVKPSSILFKKNQLIVAEGQPVTEEHLIILSEMEKGAGTQEFILAFLAMASVLYVLLLTLFLFGRKNIRKFNPSIGDFAFFCTTIALAGLVVWIGKVVAAPLAETYDWLTEDAIRYLFPVAAFAMLVRFLLYSEAALIWVAFVAPMAGLIVDNSIGYSLYMLVTCVIGADQIGKAESSSRLVRAGFFVGVVGALTAVAAQVMADPSSAFSVTTPINALAALIGGFLAGPFVMAVRYPFESVFGYSSNLQLIELANFNHPLLGRMLVEAPGTYHHSLMVSAMAEKGAQAIAANPLLAKVAGLYHDIGKVNKPHYFIENQIEGHNPHDELPPNMSALILINHVREGLDLARRHKLGHRLEEIIAEHHGRARINFFYNRALQQSGLEKEKFDDSDFRYRGPLPQSKESALVMLADVVEAATRALKKPTPARIETTVNELIGDIYNDGQLDECEMTLKDLHKVALQFATILTGRYHGRIEYPEKEQPRKGKVVHIPQRLSGGENGHENGE